MVGRRIWEALEEWVGGSEAFASGLFVPSMDIAANANRPEMVVREGALRGVEIIERSNEKD